MILNLLKFKTSDSLKTYLQYVQGVAAACSEYGFELIYAGNLKEQIQGDIGQWDSVILARYPNRRACYEMFRSDKYQAIHPLAEEALEKRVLWPSEPVMPYKTKSVEFEGGDWLEALQGFNT